MQLSLEPELRRRHAALYDALAAERVDARPPSGSWPRAPILPESAVVTWTCREAVSAAMWTKPWAACQAG